jgi:hypothetical protein
MADCGLDRRFDGLDAKGYRRTFAVPAEVGGQKHPAVRQKRANRAAGFELCVKSQTA